MVKSWPNSGLMPPTGGILDGQAPASSSTAACRTGSVILTAKPIADRGAESERRNPGQDDLSAADVLDLDSWPGTDTSLGHLTVRNPARGHARERCGEADIRDQTPRPQEDTAARSAHPSPRITLTDEAAKRERAHSRRYGRLSGAGRQRLLARITNIPSRRRADQARGPLAVCTRTDHFGGSTHPNLRPSCQSWVHLLRENRVGKPFATDPARRLRSVRVRW